MELESAFLTMISIERDRCIKGGTTPPKVVYIGTNVWCAIKDRTMFRGKLDTLPTPLLGISVALAGTPDYMGFQQEQTKEHQ